jgi:hypothetical protein
VISNLCPRAVFIVAHISHLLTIDATKAEDELTPRKMLIECNINLSGATCLGAAVMRPYTERMYALRSVLERAEERREWPGYITGCLFVDDTKCQALDD